MKKRILTTNKMTTVIFAMIASCTTLLGQFEQNTNGNFPIKTGTTPDHVNKIVTSGNYVMIGTETKGVSRLSKSNWNNGTNWVTWNSGLPAGNLNITDMTCSASNITYIICNGNVYHRAQASLQWQYDDFYDETGYIPNAIIAVNNTIYVAAWDGISTSNVPILCRIAAGSSSVASTWEVLTSTNSVFPQNMITSLNRYYVNNHWDLHITSEGNNTESGFHTRNCGANGDAGSNAYNSNNLYYNCKKVSYATDATGRLSVYVVVTEYTGPYAYGRYLMRRDYPTLCTAGWTAVTPDLGASFQYVSDIESCDGFDQLFYSFGPQNAPSSCRIWEITDPYDACGSQDQEGMIAYYADLPNENVPDIHVDGSSLYVATHSNKIYKSGFDPCIPFREAEFEAEVLDMNIYPNPASEQIVIELKEFTDHAVVRIYHISGELIMQFSASDTYQQVDVASLPSGHYIVSVIADEEVLTKAFEIAR